MARKIQNNITTTIDTSITDVEEQSIEFDPQIAINPLVAACAPLLTIATRIRAQSRKPNLKKLHSQLSYEIRVFESKAYAQSYRSHIILAARYFICVFIDEIILQNWGKDSEWLQMSLLNTFQGVGEQFFVILKRSAEEPIFHIDLLELGYLCLSLGYQGKYRENNNEEELIQFIDNLYYLICDTRGYFLRSFHTTSLLKRKQKKHHSLLMVSAFMILVVGIYLPYYISLNKALAPLLHNLEVYVKKPYDIPTQ